MAKVVVVGGGTSGFAAAIAAARAGANVTLLEQSSYLGGTMTGGLVPGIVSLRHQPWRDQETLVEMETSHAGDQVVQGIAQEMIDRLIDAGGAYGTPGQATIRVSFDPEIMKVVIDRMCREAGVAIEYHTKVTAVLRENGRVAGVKANFGNEIIADCVIDTTGDGHVAWLAGARYEQGENGDPTYVQPITMYFLMGGVELDRTIDYACSGREDFSEGYLRKLRKLYEEGKPLTIPGLPRLREVAAQAGDYPGAFGSTTLNPRAHNNILRPIFRNGKVVYDTTMHNVDMAYRVDATDNKTLSEAIGSMRDFTLKIGEFYRKYVPGYENAYVLQIADNIGVRETRRVIGEYMLTGDDVLEARSFPDSVGYCGATVDVHNIDGSEKTRMTAIRGGRLYQIPFRILVPEEIDGLLVAGRCVSADRVACGSIRQQAGCIVTGQAAGVAAALAADRRIEARHLPIGVIQQALKDQGAQL
ncbi:MAG: FAD-dependent oxidoreductase [Chelatococcus sp.]|nr:MULTISPECIES: FAD-dependent oxidoreductase [unclassified Chelatococcus]CAH1657002.1 FAD dependent oxidoreductase [Hyphomicrobiales bacterium]MBS7742371.1 FAD-dependent oxidoreductase [Chelatococcus sp. HY11]MBX3542511.1 FAD-dependent oxidoreductase [Chelatococcus sp.]MCO5075272.1 FAD-dependent oxidoreductase [Chelatococcus sp.]CAH1695945.1 FAD dependent oxidoreductase [Hyphomicrobiales bacterium]